MSDETRRNLTAQQERCLVRLLAGASIEAAARSARVSRQTASAWVNHVPLFAAELHARQTEIMARAVRRLAAGLDGAARTLVALTRHPDPEIKLRAVSELFRTFGRTRDKQELEERVAHLEALGGMSKPKSKRA